MDPEYAKYLGALRKEALELVRGGYSVIPAEGKMPRPGFIWSRYRKRRASEEEVESWFRYPTDHMGILMVMGPVSARLWVMDLDGPDSLSWAEGMVAAGAIPGTGWKSKTPHGEHWFFRLKEGVKPEPNGTDIVREPWSKKCGGESAVDTRSEGGLVIVPPSRNVEGTAYVWKSMDGVPPEWSIRDSGIEVHWKSGKARGRREAEPGRLRALVPDDVIDMRTVPSTRGEPAARGTRNSSLTSYLGKLVSNGADRTSLWHAALGWDSENRERLDREEIRRTYESVIRMHEDNHGERVPGTPELVVRDRLPVFAAGHEKPDEEDDTDEDEDEVPEEDVVPEGILHPGGLLEELMDYIEKASFRSHPLFALGMSICFVGTLMGEKILTSSGLRTNIYVVNLARSGTGKEGPMTAMKHLMFETGTAMDNFGPSDIASGAALMKSLEKKPSQLLMMDEIGDLIGSIKNPNNSYKTEILKILKETFSSRGYYSKAYANTKNDYTVPWHNLSLYATGVADIFWENLTMRELSGGFMARALVFNLNLKRRRKNSEPDMTVPDGLREKVKALFAVARGPEGADELMTVPSPPKIPQTGDAERELDRVAERYDDLYDASRGTGFLDSIYSRAEEHVRKLSLVYAASRTACSTPALCVPAFVDLEDVRKATELIDYQVPRFVKLVGDNMAWNPQDALKRRILAEVWKRGELSQAAVYRLARDCTARQVEDALKLLLMGREIIAMDKGNMTISFVLSPRSKRRLH
ncbi:MAG: bifunctional DNA primase/polymerase [Deltaproteobacteria bacterium]|jgi:hypothetical protein|nr:bifunctional DNA primase/polymerase [Deltaproteobacteria bacterium]